VEAGERRILPEGVDTGCSRKGPAGVRKELRWSRGAGGHRGGWRKGWGRISRIKEELRREAKAGGKKG